MTSAAAICKVEKAFSKVARPEAFTRGTCYCDECMEHGDILRQYTPETITIEVLGRPAWDPMCVANDQAFIYYLPAMIRLAFEADYHDQLLFHLDMPGRLEGLNPEQTEALLAVLWRLAELKEKEIFDTFEEYALGSVMRKLEQKLTGES